MRSALFLLSRLTLGVVFIVLGLNKLEDPVTFLKLIRAYDMVPETTPAMLNVVAATLPWLEIFLGGLVLLGVAVRGTGLAMILLLLVFSGAILLRGLDIAQTSGTPLCEVAFDCGCGTGEEYVCAKLGENGVLLLAGLVVLASGARTLCLRGDLFGGG